MNIELESIEVNDLTIEVSGYIYKDIEAYNDGILVTFEWELDVIREHNHDEHCEGLNVEFDERKMYVNDKHLSYILNKEDYNKVVNEIQYKLVTD